MHGLQEYPVWILQQILSELGKRFERQAAQGKPGAGVWIENHELAGWSDAGMDRAQLPPDFGEARTAHVSSAMRRKSASYIGDPSFAAQPAWSRHA